MDHAYRSGGSCFHVSNASRGPRVLRRARHSAGTPWYDQRRVSVLSNWLTDSVWFVRSWRRDPTVRGCLTMLDAIHERFAGSVGGWPRLSVDGVAGHHRSACCRSEHFNLSDDLYIKMNARGKALTPFEVLKAQLESFAGKEFGEEPARTNR